MVSVLGHIEMVVWRLHYISNSELQYLNQKKTPFCKIFQYWQARVLSSRRRFPSDICLVKTVAWALFVHVMTDSLRNP